MRNLTRLTLVLVAAGVAASCGVFKGMTRPSRETVQAALQADAQTLKTEGEKPMPGMGVKSLWTIEGVDVQEQPKDDDHPWKGTVTFRIDSAMREPDGTISKESHKKTFNYVYDAPMKKWLVQYK